MSVRSTMTRREISERWPHIGRFLRVELSGWVEDDYLTWHFAHARVSLPCAEVAAGYEEWADFYLWRLALRVGELAGDRRQRRLVERWTDDMVYMARRCAAHARGEDPGEWVPSWERRSDLDAERRAAVAEVIAEWDARPEPVEQLRKVG